MRKVLAEVRSSVPIADSFWNSSKQINNCFLYLPSALVSGRKL